MSLDDEFGTRLSRKLRSEQLADAGDVGVAAPRSDAPTLDRHLSPDVAPGDVAAFVVSSLSMASRSSVVSTCSMTSCC